MDWVAANHILILLRFLEVIPNVILLYINNEYSSNIFKQKNIYIVVTMGLSTKNTHTHIIYKKKQLNSYSLNPQKGWRIRTVMAHQQMPSSQKALMLELKSLQEEPVEGFRITLVEESDLYNWEVAIFGPPNTLYEGGYFKVSIVWI